LAHDTDHPPRNRLPTERHFLDMEVEHLSGVEHFDPNTQIMALATQPDFVAAWKPVEGTKSVISGRPAIVYRTADLEIPLTVDEYAGLVGCELEPEEFRTLLETYGTFHEIHDDFYCPVSGEAFQPKDLRSRVRVAALATGVQGNPAGPKA
jgi:hypothetical protein